MSRAIKKESKFDWNIGDVVWMKKKENIGEKENLDSIARHHCNSGNSNYSQTSSKRPAIKQPSSIERTLIKFPKSNPLSLGGFKRSPLLSRRGHQLEFPID